MRRNYGVGMEANAAQRRGIRALMDRSLHDVVRGDEMVARHWHPGSLHRDPANIIHINIIYLHDYRRVLCK